jgi:predicted transcriptional regulator of viral defense system
LIGRNYSQAEGVKLLEKIVEKYGPLFKIEDAKSVAEELDISRQSLGNALSKLVGAGWIGRVKRGVYIVDSPLFGVNTHPFAIASFLVEPMAISHWSALSHHGLTTQIPVMIQATSPKKVVTPEMREGRALEPRGRAVWRVRGLEFEFINTGESRFFGHKFEWVSEWHRVAITDRERTLLDLVARPDIFGGFGFAIEVFEENANSFDIAQLIDYAIQYDMGSVAKRLGWLLEEVGASAKLLRPLLQFPVKSYYPLDPSVPITGSRNARWRIINNLVT